MNYFTIIKQMVWSGIIAAFVMIPPGMLFKYFEMHIGNYGPKFGAFLFGEINPLILFIQHIIISCLSSVPLILLFIKTNWHRTAILAGVIYGIIYYVVVNSLLLPIFFKDPTPWELGFSYVYPSLLIHIIYGVTIGVTGRRFIQFSNSTNI